MEQILMTKEDKLHRGDVWFNPSNPEKLVVFKKPNLSAKQQNIMQKEFLIFLIALVYMIAINF